MFLYILCLSIGGISFFYTFIYKIAFSLGGRAIAVVLCKVGCSGSLALAIGYAVKSIILIEANMINPSGGELIPSNSGSGGPSHSNSWTEDSFGIRVLMEPFSETEMEGTSVNQPESGRVPPATHVAPRGDEAGPSNQPPQGVPYPYHPEQVIGGDSVLSIERRLLLGQTTPSPIDRYLARINAEDLEEVKVEIIRRMADFDPRGDWLGRGARALDNPETATGEESLEGLHSFLDDLNQGGRGSYTFKKLKEKLLLRDNPP